MFRVCKQKLFPSKSTLSFAHNFAVVGSILWPSTFAGVQNQRESLLAAVVSLMVTAVSHLSNINVTGIFTLIYILCRTVYRKM